ncbi:hypothetical protein GCU60_00590 [Blastococcus saxobsidens]|uniref:Uncharacterized protein n=1 Tax=Blastococcus saxobsidens TaxID=138336 RepID=A0A6L9VXZ5_9ACTN|nr:hypothetical protein [Blastococcus saxobsidens]NEK84274.1 hypothetical protein [Blastococcus saxobsidens]
MDWLSTAALLWVALVLPVALAAGRWLRRSDEREAHVVDALPAAAVEVEVEVEAPTAEPSNARTVRSRLPKAVVMAAAPRTCPHGRHSGQRAPGAGPGGPQSAAPPAEASSRGPARPTPSTPVGARNRTPLYRHP